jgi:hypothetical protein
MKRSNPERLIPLCLESEVPRFSATKPEPHGNSKAGRIPTMSIPSIQRHQRWLVSAAILLTVAGAFVARTAFARVTSNTTDPVGIVAENGRHLTITGPISVTAGERAELRVTVTQRSTGAVARGVAILTGTGATIQWNVEAMAEGGATFEAGPATAVALGRTTAGGKATDAHQWLVEITLARE